MSILPPPFWKGVWENNTCLFVPIYNEYKKVKREPNKKRGIIIYLRKQNKTKQDKTRQNKTKQDNNIFIIIIETNSEFRHMFRLWSRDSDKSHRA